MLCIRSSSGKRFIQVALRMSLGIKFKKNISAGVDKKRNGQIRCHLANRANARALVFYRIESFSIHNLIFEIDANCTGLNDLANRLLQASIPSLQIYTYR